MIETYKDRKEAGEKIGRLVAQKNYSCPIALGIPRGGAVIAKHASQVIDCELDIIVPRKLRAPDQPELAIGAVAGWEELEPVLDMKIVRYLGVSEDYIAIEIERQREEIRRMLALYRHDKKMPELSGRVVLLMDDGLATGSTMKAAVAWARAIGAEKVVVCVPVGPPDTVEEIAQIADEVICPLQPYSFNAVGQWYDSFDQVNDQEVIQALGS